MTPKAKILKLLQIILSSPRQYKKKELAKKIDLTTDAVSEYFEDFRNAGIDLQFTARPNYKYYINVDQSFKELQFMQVLNAKDKLVIKDALLLANKTKAHYILQKLESVYNFQELGLSSLRKPKLEKIDKLRIAEKEEKVLILKNYHSNSNTIADRHIEPFDTDPDLDTIQAFDIDKKGVRHFKISRIDRIEETDKPWQNKIKHQYKKTDVFRIANNKMVRVHLQLDIFARNNLLESFPMAKNDIFKSEKVGFYDFESNINEEFLGIKNFILNNAGHVKILYPNSLKELIVHIATDLIKNI